MFRTVTASALCVLMLSACAGKTPLSQLPPQTQAQSTKASLVYKSWIVAPGSYKPGSHTGPNAAKQRGVRDIPAGGFQSGCTYTYLNTSGMYNPTFDTLIATSCSGSGGDGEIIEITAGNRGGGGGAVVAYSDCDPSSDSDCGYDVAAAGGPAKAGDQCWSSPGTIGAFDPRPGNTNDHRLYNTTQIVQDFNNSVHFIGWVYASGDGTQWFQAYPGTSFGVAGGVIVSGSASTDIAANLVQINKLEIAIFQAGMKVAVAITGMGNVRSRGCFSRGWDGVFPA